MNIQASSHIPLDLRDHSRTHDVMTKFMSEHGFEVTKHYHLPTAWLATYKHGQGGRTIGVNSEVSLGKDVVFNLLTLILIQ